MNVRYNKFVQRDVNEIRDHDTRESGPERADEFFAELMKTIHLAAADPTRYHTAEGGLRRANLKRFPFHILYRIRPGYIRINVVKHHKRHPSFGLRRK